MDGDDFGAAFCVTWVKHPLTTKQAEPYARLVVMPKVGFEPTRPYGHYALNVARLPIPPLRREDNFTFSALFVKKSL